MTIDINDLVAKVVSTEKARILSEWRRAALAYSDATGREYPQFSEVDDARALEEAEATVSASLLSALYKASRPAQKAVYR